MKTTKLLSKFIWDFNKAVVYRQRAFMSESFSGLESVLKNLYHDGMISGYKLYKDKNCVEVFLGVDSRGNLAVKKIVNVSKPSLVISARFKELKADMRDRGHSASIVRTAKFGLTTAKFAIRHKTGGMFLGKL